MQVAVVGAGLAGLAAARTLQQSGFECTVFERSAGVGGRCSTRKVDDYVFDTGVTSFAPQGRALEQVMLHELPTDDLVQVEKPIYIHIGLRTAPGDPTRGKASRYTYTPGNMKLPQLLAEGLAIHFSTAVTTIERANGGVLVQGKAFDGVIVTLPAPETAELLTGLGVARALSSARYRACLAVSLGYALALEPVRYHAIIEPEQRHPLTWLSLESEKCSGRAPEGHTAMIAQLGPQFSEEHFEDDEGAIIGATVEYVERLYGKEWSSPAAVDLMRWRYSQPEALALFENVNKAGSQILVAGDALTGGRTEYAYESGVRAAKMLLTKP